MKRIWLIFCLLTTVLCTTLTSAPAWASDQDIRKLAGELAVKIRAKGFQRVVVADFVDHDGATNSTAKYISQKLVGLLAEQGLTVIDRSQVPKLFEEMDQITKGLIDPATSRSLGKQTGIEVVVAGTIYPGSLSIKADARAIDLEASQVIASPSHNISRMGTVGKMALKDEEGAEAEVASQSPVSQPKQQAPKAPRVINIQELRFELSGCDFGAEGMTCSSLITNTGTDADYHFRCDSRLWDRNGNEFSATEIRVSNSTHQCRKGYDPWLEKTLVSRVPTRVEVLFRNLEEEVAEVAQFEIGWSGGRFHAEQRTRFRDILVGAGAVAGDQLTQGGQLGTIAPVAPGKGGFLRRMGKLLGNAAEATARELLENEKAKLVDKDKKKGKDDE